MKPRRVLQFAFEALQAHRVVAWCHAGNLASARVMEKIGMQLEGHLRETRWLDERWNDELVYAILDHEWQAVKSPPAAGG